MADDLGALASWSGQSVTIGAVNTALDDLRCREQRTATRTSVVNLVVACSNWAAAERAGAAMRRLGSRHPGRTIAVVCRPEGDPGQDGVDARVELHQARAEGHSIWWEEVALGVSGHLHEHLDSLVEPLLLPDLPVVVWFPSELPRRDDPLVAAADVMLVDTLYAVGASGADGARTVLPALVELTRRHTVVDLSWRRLTPWRRLLAGLFDPAALAPFVGGVTRAEVAAHPAPARVLGGWLVDRLGLAPSAVALRPAVHASITLWAGSGGRAGRFAVERTSDQRRLEASAEVDGVAVQTQVAVLPEHGLTRSLAEALSRPGADRVYQHAVHVALSLL